MKLITFTVPCYNSEAYMHNCINSLLKGGEEVEIIIVNDGSSDKTGQIADSYARNYPSIVRAIHKENGGHGSGVNAGIKNANGLYFKVVDSDDWVDEASYKKILECIRGFVDKQQTVDMIISNFVYEKQGAKHKMAMTYRKAFPKEEIFSWEQTKKFRIGQYILMHSVMYRTQLLHECGIELPNHTFYVDSIYVFKPLSYVNTMYYLDVHFYRYFIGRDDQSVNEANMIRRLDQQVRVNKIMADIYREAVITNKALDKYMFNYLEIITAVTSIMAIRSQDEEKVALKDELWGYIQETDPSTYSRLKKRFFGWGGNSKSKFTQFVVTQIYMIAKRIYGFN